MITCQSCQSHRPDDIPECQNCKPAVVETLNVSSSGRRLMNHLLDSILFIVYCAIIGFILGMSGLYSAMKVESWNSTLFGYFLYTSYFIVFEFGSGQTPAKYITRTKVVSVDGSDLTISQIFLRTIFRFVPFEPFSFFGKQPIGWHDKWSKTRVVSAV